MTGLIDPSILLYSVDGEPDSAFVVNGTSVHYMNNADHYILKGNGYVVGSTEIVLNSYLGINVNRCETVVIPKSPPTDVKKISRDHFIEMMSADLSFMINAGTVMAKEVNLTNRIISDLRAGSQKRERSYKDSSLSYYRIVSAVKDENQKRRLPYLADFIKKYETSIVYKTGEAISRTAEPEKIIPAKNLDDKMVEYEKDAIIFEEGEMGNEMFLLQSGQIDVIVGGNRITTLSETGTAIGEIALLLGEPRGATLKAKNNVVVTKITHDELKEIAKRDSSILKGVVCSLAKKHFSNIELIRDVNMILAEKELVVSEEDRINLTRKFQNTLTEFAKLKEALRELVYKNKADFLKEKVGEYLK